MISYRDDIEEKEYVVFEYPHDHISFTDYLYLSKNKNIDVMTCDIKVEKFYINRYKDWLRELNELYTKI